MRRIALALVLLALVVVLALAVGYWYLQSWAQTPIQAEQGVTHDFKSGETLAELAQALVADGYLEDTLRLRILGRLSGSDRRMQAGEYFFAPELTPRQVLNKLSDGAVISYSFRIAEGETVYQMLKQLAAHPKIAHTLTATDAQSLQAEIPLTLPFAEGAFFPDTYHFPRGERDIDLLLRAHKKMQTALQQVWAQRSPDSILHDPQELLILASIVEKETGQATDRRQISQVFHKRLRDNMRLQTDPTVIYAIGQSFDGNLTRAHLGMDSPFNTYRYKGLPPTPIANPSLASLQAAAQPAPGDYLYFVARGDGSSQFSRTLAEHNAAVRKYQLGGGR